MLQLVSLLSMDEGVGETGILQVLNFDWKCNLEEEDGTFCISIRLESGTAAAGTGGKV